MSAEVSYRWNPAARRYYVASSGRFVSNAELRSARDLALRGIANEANRLGRSLVDGRLTLAEWQAGMMDVTKQSQIIGAVLARGGWQQMSQSDWGKLGASVKEQYGYLRQFAADLQSGAVPVDGRIWVRSEMYVEAARATNEQTVRDMHQEAGFQVEWRELGAADHCDDCLDYAAMGEQPIGTLPEIGDSQCGVRCHCTFGYA